MANSNHQALARFFEQQLKFDHQSTRVYRSRMAQQAQAVGRKWRYANMAVLLAIRDMVCCACCHSIT
jgi:hypothetical protein